MKITNISLATNNFNVKPVKRNNNNNSNVSNLSFKGKHYCLPRRHNQTALSFLNKLFSKNQKETIEKNYNGLTRISKKEYKCDEVKYTYKNNKQDLLFEIFENCTLDKNKNIKTDSKIISQYAHNNVSGAKHKIITKPEFDETGNLKKAESLLVADEYFISEYYDIDFSGTSTKATSGQSINLINNKTTKFRNIALDENDKLYYAMRIVKDDNAVAENQNNSASNEQQTLQEIPVREEQTGRPSIIKLKEIFEHKISTNDEQQTLQEIPVREEQTGRPSIIKLKEIFEHKISTNDEQQTPQETLRPSNDISTDTSYSELNEMIENNEVFTKIINETKLFGEKSINKQEGMNIEHETPQANLQPECENNSKFNEGISRTRILPNPFLESSKQREARAKINENILRQDELSSEDSISIKHEGRSNESILREDDIPSSNGSSARTSLSDASFSIPETNRIKARAKVLNEQYEKIQHDNSNMSTTRRKTQPILRETAKKIAKEQATPENLLNKTRTLKERHKVLKDYIENHEKELKILEEKYKRKSSDAQNTNKVQGLKAIFESENSTTNEQQAHKETTLPNRSTPSAISPKIQSLSKPFETKIDRNSTPQKQEKSSQDANSESVIENFQPVLAIPQNIKFTFVKRNSDNEKIQQKEMPKHTDNTNMSNTHSKKVLRAEEQAESSDAQSVRRAQNAQGANKVQGLKAIFEGENSTANEQPVHKETSKETGYVKELKKQIETRISTAEQQTHKETTKETGYVKELRKQIETRISTAEQQAHKETTKETGYVKELKKQIETRISTAEQHVQQKTTLQEAQKVLAQRANNFSEIKAKIERKNSIANEQHGTQEITPLLEAQTSVDPNAKNTNIVQELKAKIERKNSIANEQHGTQEITPLLEAQTSVDPNAKNTNIVQELKARVEKLGQALEELKEKSNKKCKMGLLCKNVKQLKMSWKKLKNLK